MTSLSINEMIDFLFVKNEKDIPVNLCLHQLSEPYDLFLFFVDILCKGLLLLYSENGQGLRVQLDTVDETQFKFVKKKLANAGIDVSVNVIPYTSIRPIPPFIRDGKNVLEDYAMVITTKQSRFEVKFKLFHALPPNKNGIRI
jgi:hypothetical protein